ncbi:hypothetical protein [Neobacillus niacini]|uniref:hypothetical protein n=1 Tax=Neobacillus niacini TaxID=86668 RepID=UPI0005EF7373|nr:hypothetical protein [Neobacillus niacini]
MIGLKDVEDTALIKYVSESIQRQEIHRLYGSFCQQEGMFIEKEDIEQDEDDTYLDPKWGELTQVIPISSTLSGQEKTSSLSRHREKSRNR